MVSDITHDYKFLIVEHNLVKFLTSVYFETRFIFFVIGKNKLQRKLYPSLVSCQLKKVRWSVAAGYFVKFFFSTSCYYPNITEPRIYLKG